MALFILSVPLMALAVAAAVIPLLVISHREHQRHQAELPVAGPSFAPHAGATPRVVADVEGREASPLAAYTYRGGASDTRVVYEAAAKR